MAYDTIIDVRTGRVHLTPAVYDQDGTVRIGLQVYGEDGNPVDAGYEVRMTVDQLGDLRRHLTKTYDWITEGANV